MDGHLSGGFEVAKQRNETDLIKARVLLSCPFGPAGSVVELPADEIAEGEVAGMLDSNPDAVAYAESLNA